jgi:hypothetical protein
VVTVPEADPDLPPLPLRDQLAWPFNKDAAVLGDRLERGAQTVVMLVDLTGLDWPAIAPLLPPMPAFWTKHPARTGRPISPAVGSCWPPNGSRWP